MIFNVFSFFIVKVRVLGHAYQGMGMKDPELLYFPGRWEILVIPGKCWTFWELLGNWSLSSISKKHKFFSKKISKISYFPLLANSVVFPWTVFTSNYHWEFQPLDPSNHVECPYIFMVKAGDNLG